MNSDLKSHPGNDRDSNLKCFVIIVAGGSGSRMMSALPKQFLLANGKPVLMHTIEAFFKSVTSPQIMLVLHESFHQYWESTCKQYNFLVPHQVLNGGKTRFHSVKNGLNSISETASLIAVHDAVRPLIEPGIIDGAYAYAHEHGNAVVAVQSRDSVRLLRNSLSTPFSRDEIYLIQTPQIFQAKQIKTAYLQPYDQQFTDDASVVEKAGFKINLVEGSHKNIKITFPEDIAVASALLHKASS